MPARRQSTGDRHALSKQPCATRSRSIRWNLLCCGLLCWGRIRWQTVETLTQGGSMSDSPKLPLFSEAVRREFYERRVLVLDGPLDDDNGTLLATQLIALATEDPSADISLWIHSPGGSVPSMLAIRDVMRTIPNDVSTLVFGIAYSAGQFLLSAGTTGKRRALPHSRVLMHQGSAGIGGSAIDIELQADDLRHTRDTVLRLIAEDTGQPIERVFEDSLHDHWYTAHEALEYGFIDAIVESFDDFRPHARVTTGFSAAIDGSSR
jgi:ATP-dependent Clp protease, protease subunit